MIWQYLQRARRAAAQRKIMCCDNALISWRVIEARRRPEVARSNFLTARSAAGAPAGIGAHLSLAWLAEDIVGEKMKRARLELCHQCISMLPVDACLNEILHAQPRAPNGAPVAPLLAPRNAIDDVTYQSGNAENKAAVIWK